MKDSILILEQNIKTAERVKFVLTTDDFVIQYAHNFGESKYLVVNELINETIKKNIWCQIQKENTCIYFKHCAYKNELKFFVLKNKELFDSSKCSKECLKLLNMDNEKDNILENEDIENERS